MNTNFLTGESLAVMIPALLMLQRAISSVGSLWTTRKVSLPAIELLAEMMAPHPSVRDGDGRDKPATVRGRLAFEDVRWGVDGRTILGRFLLVLALIGPRSAHHASPISTRGIHTWPSACRRSEW